MTRPHDTPDYSPTVAPIGGPAAAPTSEVALARILVDADYLASGTGALYRSAPYRHHFPVHRCEPGFPMLVRSILAQQVSNAAAAAMWRRLCAHLDPVSPNAFLALDIATLNRCGFSRQKRAYARGIAEAICEGRLDLQTIDAMPDDSAIDALCELKGIGPWSAECYLIFGLSRRDRLPAGDLALQTGWQRMTGRSGRATPQELMAAAEAWRPRRSAAAFLLWAYYIGSAGTAD